MNDPTPPLDLNEIAALIQATPQTLRQELNGLGAEVWQWRPAPDQWCINEVIGHLIEVDRNAFDPSRSIWPPLRLDLQSGPKRARRDKARCRNTPNFEGNRIILWGLSV